MPLYFTTNNTRSQQQWTSVVWENKHTRYESPFFLFLFEFSLLLAALAAVSSGLGSCYLVGSRRKVSEKKNTHTHCRRLPRPKPPGTEKTMTTMTMVMMVIEEKHILMFPRDGMKSIKADWEALFANEDDQNYQKVVPRTSSATMPNVILDIASFDWTSSYAKQDIKDAVNEVSSCLPTLPKDYKQTIFDAIQSVYPYEKFPPISLQRGLLFPPGKCIHLYRDGNFRNIGKNIDPCCTFFSEIVVHRRMIHDHTVDTGYVPADFSFWI